MHWVEVFFNKLKLLSAVSPKVTILLQQSKFDTDYMLTSKLGYNECNQHNGKQTFYTCVYVLTVVICRTNLFWNHKSKTILLFCFGKAKTPTVSRFIRHFKHLNEVLTYHHDINSGTYWQWLLQSTSSNMNMNSLLHVIMWHIHTDQLQTQVNQMFLCYM